MLVQYRFIDIYGLFLFYIGLHLYVWEAMIEFELQLRLENGHE